MKFFKPEDFDSYQNYPPQMNSTAIMAAIANQKLEREGKIVYSTVNMVEANEWRHKLNQPLLATHKALIINIEEIEHPKDDLFEKLLEENPGLEQWLKEKSEK